MSDHPWCPPVGTRVVLRVTGEVYTVVAIRPEPAMLAHMGREWSATGPGGVVLRQYEHEFPETWRFDPIDEAVLAAEWARQDCDALTGKASEAWLIGSPLSRDIRDPRIAAKICAMPRRQIAARTGA